MLITKELTCDLCVVGGGLAGMAAAISAAREGLKVVLMHERPVLGGNASSEIRMWVCGAKGRDNRETGIVEELFLENMYRNPTKNYAIWDSVLYDLVKREENLQLLLNCTCMDAETDQGEFAYGRNRRIRSITGYQMTTQQFIKVKAEYFCDCSGDSILAPLTGAEFRIGREAGSEFGEDSKVTEPDRMTMGMSCLIQGRETLKPVTFTPPSWSAKLTSEHFEHRKPRIYDEGENYWYLELGGDRDSIGDTEELRDELLGLAMGTWDHIKNSGEYKAENWDLNFLGFLPGKRESRRMVGEHIITQKEITDGKVFEDEIAFGGWPLDDHYPGGFYHKGEPNTIFHTPAPYSLPYRALYSKNVENLFFAGRNISMTHLAMSSIRVMATCSLLGEAVGKAAALAVKNHHCPHEVYLKDLEALQEKLMNEDCFLPHKLRPVSEACRKAELRGAPDLVRNGQDRPHPLYGTAQEGGLCQVPLGGQVIYSFAPQMISSIHLVFSSDLNRDSLDGPEVERRLATRANFKLEEPTLHMPTPLCREFRLLGERDGRTTELLHVTENRKRCYHLKPMQEFDKLILLPVTSWGDETVGLISFDFC